MNNEEALIIHEKKKKEFAKFIETFNKEVIDVFNLQEDTLWEQSEYQSTYISTVAVLIRLFSEDNKVTVTPEEFQNINEELFHIKVDKEDDGGVTYSLVIEEAPDNADTNGRENLQAEV